VFDIRDWFGSASLVGDRLGGGWFVGGLFVGNSFVDDSFVGVSFVGGRFVGGMLKTGTGGAGSSEQVRRSRYGVVMFGG
jgi:hypothetical protein